MNLLTQMHATILLTQNLAMTRWCVSLHDSIAIFYIFYYFF
ncbi:hypothetical protein [Helicobacter sp.]|nr:hypothetical protein [Helicobacter sp.]MDY5556243.1 hypothetical protein [Helicobacter sp.]